MLYKVVSMVAGMKRLLVAVLVFWSNSLLADFYTVGPWIERKVHISCEEPRASIMNRDVKIRTVSEMIGDQHFSYMEIVLNKERGTGMTLHYDGSGSVASELGALSMKGCRLLEAK
ncbi:hypothetical protein CGK27_16075 [Vibrio parahaemolyticus]|nr:hypothetical protein CGK25_23165 [Vibrio parahaemolyticus]TOA54270.1 hypothetical protein CGK27_16075 [Vibrio parahaemolyticus]TOA95020.1 hypothetical protein CGK15_22770 [Vibrio parahaemolyticus]TOO23117.1 hypothetical protein CGH41_21960 [Vibrio parahaemolyticus]